MAELVWVSLGVALVTTSALRPLSFRWGLIDWPGGRKTHDGEVPLVGGIAMFVAFAVGLGLMPAADRSTWALIGGSSVLLAVGIADDRFDVSARMRLCVHFIAACFALLMLGAVSQLSLGKAFSMDEPLVLTGWLGFSAALVIVAGAINAFNMIDGMDGLAGVLAAVAFAGLGWVAWSAGDAYAAQLCGVMLGAVGGFLVYNLPMPWNRRWRVFMGDAGSTLLGFLVAVVALRLTQHGSAVAPVTALWFAAVPVGDLLTSMVRRAASGRSPFSGDRGHLHHRLLDAGFTPAATLVMLGAAAGILALLGLWMHTAQVNETVQMIAFLSSAAALAVAAAAAPRWTYWAPTWCLIERARPRRLAIAANENEQ